MSDAADTLTVAAEPPRAVEALRQVLEDQRRCWQRGEPVGVETYLERCHLLCGQMRLLEGPGSLMDRRREAFMAAEIAMWLLPNKAPTLSTLRGTPA